MRGSRRPGVWVGPVLLLMALLLVGCAGLGPRVTPHTTPLRVSDYRSEGDAIRRASTEIVLMGLDADISGRPDRALSQYERALQVDPNNPYAYLALARHLADSSRPQRAAPYLARAETLFSSQQPPNEAVRVHLLGLRGQLDVASSPTSAASRRRLAEAADRAPGVWTDGRLSADELF